jgi:hypothetical protein
MKESLSTVTSVATVFAAFYALVYYVFWPRFRLAVNALIDKKLEAVMARMDHYEEMRISIERFGAAVDVFHDTVQELKHIRTEVERQGRIMERVKERLWPHRDPSPGSDQ